MKESLRTIISLAMHDRVERRGREQLKTPSIVDFDFLSRCRRCGQCLHCRRLMQPSVRVDAERQACRRSWRKRSRGTAISVSVGAETCGDRSVAKFAGSGANTEGELSGLVSAPGASPPPPPEPAPPEAASASPSRLRESSSSSSVTESAPSSSPPEESSPPLPLAPSSGANRLVPFGERFLAQ
jgi:hypothetical protein